jgi:hypothetical protein
LTVRNDSKIDFANIVWRKEHGAYIVWEEGSSNFIELSESSFLAYKLLREGNTPGIVAEILSHKYEETYDVKDFVQELTKLGFISAIDGIPIPRHPPKNKTFTFIEKSHVTWIYSTSLLILYLGLMSAAFVVVVSDPRYLPSYADFFFADSYVVVLAVSFTLGLALVCLHEFAHLIAGKAVGVDGYFSIGIRLYMPVAETNLSRLWTVPRKKRLIPFLAGMLNDALLLSVLVLLLWFADQNATFGLGAIAALMRLCILLLYYGLIWQFLLFIRTDVYYAISTVLGCRNLYSDSWTLIFNSLLKVFTGKQKKPQIPARELRVVRVYAPIMLMATGLSLLLFAFLGLPIFALLFVKGVNSLLAASEGNLGLFVEGLILTCLMGLQIAGFFFFVIRSLVRFNSRIKTVSPKEESPEQV